MKKRVKRHVSEKHSITPLIIIVLIVLVGVAIFASQSAQFAPSQSSRATHADSFGTKVENVHKEEILLGDANGDGIVELKDAILVAQFLYGPHLEVSQGADVDQNGRVNEDDVIEIVKGIYTVERDTVEKNNDVIDQKVRLGPSSGLGVSDICNSPFIRGDTNDDRASNLGSSDLLNLIYILFVPSAPIDPPRCMDQIDVNDDGFESISDIQYLAEYLYGTGPFPPGPSYIYYFSGAVYRAPAAGYDEQINDNWFLCDGIDQDGDGLVDEGECLFGSLDISMNLVQEFDDVLDYPLTSDHFGDYLGDGEVDGVGYTQIFGFDIEAPFKHFSDNDYLDGQPSLGAQLLPTDWFGVYEIEFDNSIPGPDLIGEQLTMMQRDYTVLGVSDQMDEITLLRNQISDTLTAGESITYSFDGTTYEVSIVFMDATVTTFNVDGVVYSLADSGEFVMLPDGNFLALLDRSFQGFAGGVLISTFAIGDSFIELGAGQILEIDDEIIDEVGVDIDLSSGPSGLGVLRIDLIWDLDDEAFITEESSVSFPGFGGFAIEYNGFITPASEVVDISPVGSDVVELTVNLIDGEYTFPILYSDGITLQGLGSGVPGEDLLMVVDEDSVVFDADVYGSLLTTGILLGTGDATYGETYVIDLEIDASQSTVSVINKVNGEVPYQGLSVGDTFTLGVIELSITSIDVLENEVGLEFVSVGVFGYIITPEGLMFQPPTDCTLQSVTGCSASLGALFEPGVDTSADIIFFEEDTFNGALFEGEVFQSTLTVSPTGIGASNLFGDISGDGPHETLISGVYEAYVESEIGSRIDLNENTGELHVTYHGDESVGRFRLLAN